MKREELKFEVHGKDKTADYTRMLFDRITGKDYLPRIEEILEESKNPDDFIRRLCNEESLNGFYAIAKITKEYMPQEHWYKVRGLLGGKIFKTDSEMGSVKIGNDNFSILIPNGYGDGTSRVAVLDKEEFPVGDYLDYFTTIKGKFYIFRCDWSENVIPEQLDGEYAVYSWNGFVAFVKRKEEF